MYRRELLASVAAAGTVGGSLASVGARVGRSEASTGQSDGDGTAGEASPFEPLGTLDLSGARELVTDPGEPVAYVAVNDGVATLDVSEPEDPRVLAERRDLLADADGGPLRDLWDVALDDDRLLGVAQAQPRDEDDLHAAVLFDVADPAAPELLDAHGTGYPIHNCALADGSAYLTANDGERQALDVLDAGDDALEYAGSWSLLDYDEAWGDVSPTLRQLHDVTVRADLDVAVLSQWEAGTWLLDVSDPSSPTALGHVAERDRATLAEVESVVEALFVPPGNAHNATFGPDGDLLAVGREAWQYQHGGCLTGGPSGVDLYDASDPGSIEHLVRIDPPKADRNTQSDQFTTAHNFAFAGDRFYTSWYHGGAKLFDVSDPSEPRELAWWREPDEAALWTAEPVAGRSCFAASSADGVAGYDDGIEGRIYVFPDRPGEQPDPPSLLDRPDDLELQPRCDVARLAAELRGGDGSRSGDTGSSGGGTDGPGGHTHAPE